MQYKLRILADEGRVAEALRALADEIEDQEDDLDGFESETEFYDASIEEADE